MQDSDILWSRLGGGGGYKHGLWGWALGQPYSFGEGNSALEQACGDIPSVYAHGRLVK